MNLPFKIFLLSIYLSFYLFLLQDCAQSVLKGVLDFRAVIISTEVKTVIRDYLLQQSGKFSSHNEDVFIFSKTYIFFFFFSSLV